MASPRARLISMQTAIQEALSYVERVSSRNGVYDELDADDRLYYHKLLESVDEALWDFTKALEKQATDVAVVYPTNRGK